MGLNMKIDLEVQQLIVMVDFDLLIRQAQGDWKTKYLKLLAYKQCLDEISKLFKFIEFRYIPRFLNDFTYALATLSQCFHILATIASLLWKLKFVNNTTILIQLKLNHMVSNGTQT